MPFMLAGYVISHGMERLILRYFVRTGAAFNVTHFESRITHLLYTAINTTEHG
jgi:UDP-glucose 4-epimerase